MTFAGFFLLVVVVFAFSAYEKRLWASRKTPFAFLVYPFLIVLFIAVALAPSIGFERVHIETIFVIACSFALFAIASVAMARIAGDKARVPSLLEASGTTFSSGGSERTVWSAEYLGVGGILLLVLGASILDRAAGDVLKGELGVGSIASHMIEVGIVYLVIAASQHGGQRLVRTSFVLLMLWILAINQVKYLILLPLAAAVLYRWVSGQLSTWKVVLMGFAVPLALVIAVYGYFGVAAATGSIDLSPALVRELARHMLAYLVAGVLGLDQLLIHARPTLFGAAGLEYALAPFVNLFRFVTGAGNYFDVVNPLYLVIHPNGLDSNVFTLFGSLLYRGGWVGAVSITLAYALISYWVWSRWRMRQGALACAPGSWWMSPLLFAWFDPLFTQLSIIEIMALLTVRGSLRVGHLLKRVPRSRSVTVTTFSA